MFVLSLSLYNTIEFKVPFFYAKSRTCSFIVIEDISEKIKGKIKGDIDKLQEKNQRLPKLVVILVGNNQASNAYVKGKVRIVRKLEYSTLL